LERAERAKARAEKVDAAKCAEEERVAGHLATMGAEQRRRARSKAIDTVSSRYPPVAGLIRTALRDLVEA
jgi:hypothetical protein